MKVNKYDRFNNMNWDLIEINLEKRDPKLQNMIVMSASILGFFIIFFHFGDDISWREGLLQG